jgi:hypothetical protein
VLIKLIRLIAHLVMGPEEGTAIAAAPEAVCLLQLLSALPLEPTRVGDAPPLCIEELQLNTLSAVTNLTFYTAGRSLLGASGRTGPAPGTRSVNVFSQGTREAGSAGEGDGGGQSGHHERALCGLLAQALTHPNPEAAAEAARALGNISRLPSARLALCDLLADEALLILLESPSAQVRRGMAERARVSRRWAEHARIRKELAERALVSRGWGERALTEGEGRTTQRQDSRSHNTPSSKSPSVISPSRFSTDPTPPKPCSISLLHSGHRSAAPHAVP